MMNYYLDTQMVIEYYNNHEKYTFVGPLLAEKSYYYNQLSLIPNNMMGAQCKRWQLSSLLHSLPKERFC